MKSIKNNFQQPISQLAKHMYQEAMNRNEKGILAEADPKVTFVLDNNMRVSGFMALGGDSEKKAENLGKKKFTFFGQDIYIPYERVEYEVADMATNAITKTSVEYIDSKDSEKISELYKEFYALAQFLVPQEIAMKGLLPALTEKGSFIKDDRTGLPLVGDGFLINYFGLTDSADPNHRNYWNAVSDANRWAFGSFSYQIKANFDIWRRIHKAFTTGDINSYGNGPSLTNVGVSNFMVNNSAPNEPYIPGATINERPSFSNVNNTMRSDIANIMIQQQAGPNVEPSAIQPNVPPAPAAPAPTGPVKVKK